MAEKDDRIIEAEALAATPSEPPEEAAVQTPAEMADETPAEPLIAEEALLAEEALPPEPQEQMDIPSLPPMPEVSVVEPAAPAPAAQKSSGGFLAALLGGAIALGAGFGLSHFDILNLRQAPDLSAYDAKLAGLEAQLIEADGRIKALAEIAPVDSADPSAALAEFGNRLAALEERLNGLPAGESETLARDLAALSAKVAEISAVQPSGLSDQAIRQIIETEIDARAEAARQKAIAEAEAATEAMKAEALREAALASLREAKVNGQPFAAALQTLGASAPNAGKFAESGLVSLAQLQEGFADPAREALALSLRETAGERLGDRLWSFLRIQSGARSLSPQEGNDPDAVLSRAEAALAKDDLASALSELKALPPAGQAAMAEWMAQAQARLDALAEIDQITSVKE